jgi:hypothetical protein
MNYLIILIKFQSESFFVPVSVFYNLNLDFCVNFENVNVKFADKTFKKI